MKHGESYCHLLSNFIQILENLFKEIYKDLEINSKIWVFWGKKETNAAITEFLLCTSHFSSLWNRGKKSKISKM